MNFTGLTANGPLPTDHNPKDQVRFRLLIPHCLFDAWVVELDCDTDSAIRIQPGGTSPILPRI
jgi:hypothetical protein